MSKEQTPITFKQFKERGELCEFCGEPTSIASREKHKRGVICSCDWVDKKAEQYANTKVLETLEREFNKTVIHRGGDLWNGKEYYETEVKPKYDL